MTDENCLEITRFDNGKLYKEVEDQVNITNRPTRCLNDIIWKNNNMGKNIRKNIQISLQTNNDISSCNSIQKNKNKNIVRNRRNRNPRKNRQQDTLGLAQESRYTSKMRCGNISDWIQNRTVEWNDHTNKMIQ